VFYKANSAVSDSSFVSVAESLVRVGLKHSQKNSKMSASAIRLLSAVMLLSIVPQHVNLQQGMVAAFCII